MSSNGSGLQRHSRRRSLSCRRSIGIRYGIPLWGIDYGDRLWAPGIFENKLKNHVEEEKSEAQFPEPFAYCIRDCSWAYKLSVSSFLWNSVILCSWGNDHRKLH
jgi:hypothetical protein